MDFPAYLTTMPMHAITEVYGEDGLRERFRLEIRRFGPADRERLTDALALASDLHRDDRRVREPYLNHLLRVSIRIMHHYEVDDVDVLVAAVLHDSAEDHPVELSGRDSPEAALGVLAERFGARTARLVGAVTNPAWDPARDKNLQYLEHVRDSLAGEPWARVIKVSDFTDNGVGVIHTTGPKVTRSATKYRPVVPILRELVARTDTPLSRLVKQHIYHQLDLAEERFAAILDPAL